MPLRRPRAVWIPLALLAVAIPAVATQPLGSDTRVSRAGTDGSTAAEATDPAIAHDTRSGRSLVVWTADATTDGENEIFGSLVDARGVPLGGEFRISDMGADGDTGFDAFNPAVAYNSIADEYLVVWDGDDNTAALVNNENEVFAQRISAAGAEIGGDIRISEMGADGDINFAAFNPSVAVDTRSNQYLIAWQGDDSVAPLVDEEVEVFVQRLSATGIEVGGDTRISDMGPDGNTAFGAFSPAVAYNATADEYLVAWHGDDNTGALVDNENEIFVQRLSSGAVELGGDTRISDMGPDGNPAFVATFPAIAFDATANQYLVSWTSDDNTGALVDEEFEIFAQRLSATGAELGADTRVSDMGPDGNTEFAALTSAVAANGPAGEFLVVWAGDDNTAPLVDNEFEIFGQRISTAGADIGVDTRLSDMGADGNALFDADSPAVVRSTTVNEYLTVFRGNDGVAPLAAGEVEIFLRRALAGSPPVEAPAPGTPPVRKDCSVTILGTARGDVRTGNARSNRIDGLGGNDTLRGRGGNDCLLGRGGDDRLLGDPGNDLLVGGPDDDTLAGGPGRDRLQGGPGADILTGGTGTDTLAGGPGSDLINARDGIRDIITCGAGADTASVDRIDRVTGTGPRLSA